MSSAPSLVRRRGATITPAAQPSTVHRLCPLSPHEHLGRSLEEASHQRGAPSLGGGDGPRRPAHSKDHVHTRQASSSHAASWILNRNYSAQMLPFSPEALAITSAARRAQ